MMNKLLSKTISLYDAASELGLVNKEAINNLLSYSNDDLQIFFIGDIRGYSVDGPVIDQSGGRHDLPMHLVPDTSKIESEKYRITLSEEVQLLGGACVEYNESSLFIRLSHFKYNGLTYKTVPAGAEVFFAEELRIDKFYIDRREFNRFINGPSYFTDQENFISAPFSDNPDKSKPIIDPTSSKIESKEVVLKSPKSGSSEHFGSEVIDAFDPLPTSTIADIFKLGKRSHEDNLIAWKKLVARASENGLIISRRYAGEGSSESTFNPASIANWMITKKGLSAEKATSKLKKNLPDRSKNNLEDLFGPDEVIHPFL